MVGQHLPIARLGLLAVLAALVIGGVSLLGPTELSARVYWDFRLPRTLLAAVVGAGLALGGAVFQALFRNPLATPYTLGISGGAALGAAIAYVTGWRGVWLGVSALTFSALLSGLLAMGVVLAVAQSRAGKDMTRLLLAGVCVSYLASAGTLLATYLSDQAVTNEIVMWLMGSLATYQLDAAGRIALVLAPVALLALYHHRALDLLLTGDHLAASRGVDVTRVTNGAFILIGLLTAVIVATCGPIGFIGLMVPHMVRALLGPRSLTLMLGSLVAGGAFLAACDGLGRSLYLYEIPVGIITNLIGAAFFFYLLVSRGVTPTPR